MFAEIVNGRHPRCKAGQTHVYDVRREDMTDPADRGWPDREGQTVRPAAESRISLGYRGKNQTQYLVTPTTFMVVAADNPRARKIITDHVKVFDSMVAQHPLFNSKLREEQVAFDMFKKELIDEVSELCITEIRKIKDFNEAFEDEIRRQIRRLLGSEDALDQDLTDIVDIDNESVSALNKKLGLKDEERVNFARRNDPIKEQAYWTPPTHYQRVKERWIFDPELKGKKVGHRISSGYVRGIITLEEFSTEGFTFHPHEDIGSVEIRHLCLPVHNMVMCPIARRMKEAMISWKAVREAFEFRIGRVSIDTLVKEFTHGDEKDEERVRYALHAILLSNRELAQALAHALGPVRRKSAIRSFKVKSSTVAMEALLAYSELDNDLDTYFAGRRQLQALREMEDARVNEAVVKAQLLAKEREKKAMAHA